MAEREGFEPNSDPVTYQQLTESDENSDPPIVLIASRSVQVCTPQSVPVKHWRGYPTLGSTTWQLKKRAKESPRHFCRRPFISDSGNLQRRMRHITVEIGVTRRPLWLTR